MPRRPKAYMDALHKAAIKENRRRNLAIRPEHSAAELLAGTVDAMAEAGAAVSDEQLGNMAKYRLSRGLLDKKIGARDLNAYIRTGLEVAKKIGTHQDTSHNLKITFSEETIAALRASREAKELKTIEVPALEEVNG